MRLNRDMIGMVVVTVISAWAANVRAEEPEELRELGYGHPGNNRFALTVGRTAGERGMPGTTTTDPMTGASVTNPAVKEDYSQLAVWASYNYYTFWDKTRFDTLVGGEFSASVGYVSQETADPERKPEPTEDWSKFHAQMDWTFDYALVHWGGGLPGRVVFGAGAGGELGSYWYNKDASAYPLLRGRLQLFPNQSLGVHLGYRWIPTTTGDYTVREHLFDGAVNLQNWQVGARATLTQVLDVKDVGGQDLSSLQLAATVGYVF